VLPYLGLAESTYIPVGFSVIAVFFAPFYSLPQVTISMPFPPVGEFELRTSKPPINWLEEE
jgi:hypothetical protein